MYFNNTIKDAYKEIENAAADRLCSLLPEDFRKDMEEIIKQSGVKERPLYNLRHTFASQMISRGADIVWVSNMLGHKNVSITLSTYTKFIKEDDEVNIFGTVNCVGVFNSISNEFDFSAVRNNLRGGGVDVVRSELEPSPAIDSGRLLAYCIERKKKTITCLIRHFFHIT